jgi:dihydrofolate reductase
MTTLYAATMSLDGFIAGREGDMSWLGMVFAEAADEPREDPGLDGSDIESLMERVGCLLVGGRTQRGDDPNAGTEEEGAFGGRYDEAVVVLTRTPPAQPEPGVEYLTEVRTAVARATDLAGEKYVCVLGAHAARSCLEAGLLDEVLMDVAPVLLGDGVRVFDRPHGPPVLLDRKPGTTSLWYTVRR